MLSHRRTKYVVCMDIASWLYCTGSLCFLFGTLYKAFF